MATAAQNRAYARGTTAALTRKEERMTSLLQIDHSPGVDGLTLLRATKHTLAVSGAADQYRIKISLVDSQPDLQDALRKSQELNVQMSIKLAEAERTIAEMKKQPSGLVSLTKAAAMHGVNYSTMWRAHRDGRLKTSIIGGKQKDQLMCDPTTYMPVTKRLRKSK